MGLGCLNPGKCNCDGNECWDCPLPTSVSVLSPVGFPCFDVLNGAHIASACNWQLIPPQPYILHGWQASPNLYLPYGTLTGGVERPYIRLCSGGELTQTQNPNPTPGQVYNYISDDIIVSADMTVQLFTPSRIDVDLTYLTVQDVVFDNFGLAPNSQTILGRTRRYTFRFSANLTSCAGQALSPVSTEIVDSGEFGFVGIPPTPDSGAFAITAADFDVSVQMP